MNTCTFPECEKPMLVREWCKSHYEKWRAHGTPEGKPKIHSLDRLHERIIIDLNGCWLWQGSRNWSGHGQMGVRNSKRRIQAHRAVYEKFRGPIPNGLVLDHLCRVPACVNPAHLEPVTQAENIARAPGGLAQAKRAKTHCPKGHSYSGANLYLNPKGSRECRVCRAAKKH